MAVKSGLDKKEDSDSASPAGGLGAHAAVMDMLHDKRVCELGARYEEAELDWILENAPQPMRDYMSWQMDNAIKADKTFALFSMLLFFQAFVGRGFRLPRDLRCNLWLLLFAPTESGKGAAVNLAAAALAQLLNKHAGAAIPYFENRFGSYAGLLWHLVEHPQTIWVNEEMVKVLVNLMAAKPGTESFVFNTILMELHDAAVKPYVAPLRYTGHDARAKKMPPLKHPFLSVVGTGVVRDIGKLGSAANADGSLNRFLAFVVTTMPRMKDYGEVGSLPKSVEVWALNLAQKKLIEFTDPDNPTDQLCEPVVLGVYPEMKADLIHESERGTSKAQDMPGVWGRYGEKILQVAMLYAIASSPCNDIRVTREGFMWATRLVRLAVERFQQQFTEAGAGGESVTDKMADAFKACFARLMEKPEFARKGYVSDSDMVRNCRAWKENPEKRGIVVKALEAEGVMILGADPERRSMAHRYYPAPKWQ